MKKLPRAFRNILLCIAVIFLLFCLSEFLSSIHVSGDGLFFKISCIVFFFTIWCVLIFLFMEYKYLSDFRNEEKTNFIIKFPKKPVSGWGTLDSTLADLSYDYGLDEYQIKRIALEGVRDAASQYRKDHPMDDPQVPR